MKSQLKSYAYAQVCYYLKESGWFQDPDDHGIWCKEDGDGMTIGAAFDIQLVEDKVDET